MIGLIRFAFRGGTAAAVLRDDGYWGCDAVPCLVRPLDILYSPIWGRLPAGRRHLEAAARWLKGTVVFGAARPIPRTARPLVRRVRGDLFVRRSHQPVAPSTERSDRVTERAAAKMCGVGLGIIRLWVETGAWPMPRRGGAAPATFGLSEVEAWLATGAWPAGAQFQAATAQASLPTLLASRWDTMSTYQDQGRSQRATRGHTLDQPV